MIRRELHGNLLLALFSLKRNFNIYISDTATFKYLLGKNLINPGILHTKSITHGEAKSKFHQQLIDKNFKITAIDEEHGLLDNYDYNEYFISNRLSKKELSKITAFFCWGNYDYQKLKKYFTNQKTKFYLTGSPRSDIWKSKINFKDYNNSSKTLNKPYVLICTNFSFSNNINSYRSIINAKKKEGYYNRTPKLLKRDQDFYPYQKKLIKKFVKLINNLSKKFPNLNFYVRPHPVENMNFWHNKLVKRKNLFINNTGNASSWIKNCKLMIQSGCTTGCEGIMSDKIVINYIPVKYNGNGEFLKKISLNVMKDEKIFKLIKNFENINFNKKKYQKILNKRIQFKKKKLAVENILSVWVKISKKLVKKSNNNILIYLNLLLYENIKSLYLVAKLILTGKYQRIKKKLNYKFPEIKENIIKDDIEGLSKNFNLNNNAKIKKLGKRLFFIH